MTTLSYSQITEHRRCAQSWMYKYPMRLERPMLYPTPERDFGSWWQALRAIDSINRGRDLGTLRECPAELRTVEGGPEFVTATDTVDYVLKSAEKWWDAQDEQYRDAFIQAIGSTLYERLEALDVSWRGRWAKDIENEQPVAVEVRWERELPDGTVLMGFIDEVYFDLKRKMLVVRDNKAHKALSTATSLDDMMDSQLQFYAWGVAPRAADWGFGPIRATAYDRVRSLTPRTPVLTATGTLSKAITDYDLETYAVWSLGPEGNGVAWGEPDAYYVSGAKKGQPKFGLYTTDPKVTAALDSPEERSKWFQRTLTPINRILVQTHLVAAVDTAEDIARSQERFETKKECGRNLGKNCSWCPFADLCRAQMRGGPDGEYDFAQYGLVVRA